MCYICNYKCVTFAITFVNIRQYKVKTKYFQKKNDHNYSIIMKGIDIKEFRRVNNMTQTALAEYLGITQAFVSNMEADRDTIPEKYIRKILEDPNVDSSMFARKEKREITQVPSIEDVKMPREVFEKIAQLIDTVCSQQGTIADQQKLITDQHRTIDRLTTSSVESKIGARSAEAAGCADVG